MKKIKNICLLILLIFTFTACKSSNNLKDLSYSKFKDMLDNKETFFFIVVKDGCSYCEAYEPKVEEVLDEYNITGYKLNTSKLSESEYNEFQDKFNIEGTPTTIFITEGSEKTILQRYDGNVSKETIISKLKANNYIKK